MRSRSERAAKRPDPRLTDLPEGFQYKFDPNRGVYASEEERDQVMLAMGKAGERLLRDTDFQLALQELMDESLTQIVHTKPGQWEVREDCYFRVRGIQEIAYRLQGWVRIAEQVQSRLSGEEK